MNFTITTDRLILRVLDATNADAVLDFYRKYAPAFQAYESPYPETFLTRDYQMAMLEAEHKLLLRGSMIRYWIFERSSSNDPTTAPIIGTVSFRNIQPSPVLDCELGYKIAPDYQCKGYATEALQATLPILFDEFHMHRIHAQVEDSNLPSVALLKTLGFEKEGTNRSAFLSSSGWKDVDLYAKIH